MKSDIRLTKLAKLLVHYSVNVQKGNRVYISGTTASEALLRELYAEVLLTGGHPRIHMEFEDQKYLFFSLAKEHQLEYVDNFTVHEMENIDAAIYAFPDQNPHSLTSIAAEKKQKVALAQKPIMDTVFKRWGEGSLKWVGTVCPTPALAQEAHMSTEEYTEFVFASMKLNDKDPVKFWTKFSVRQQKICERLDKIKEMHYIGPDTDLIFRCEGRKWINCDGKNNFPDGEIFTGPIEDSVEGNIRFTFPGIFQGEEIEDIFLRFSKGKVVEAKAQKGEELLTKLLETDEGARYVGEIAIGTNDNIKRFTKNMLFDEKMGKTVHLAIGKGIPMSGSKNESAIHWDMLKDMSDGSEIYADGNLIYKNGSFIEDI
jgi:aminopeptidase